MTQWRYHVVSEEQLIIISTWAGSVRTLRLQSENIAGSIGEQFEFNVSYTSSAGKWVGVVR